MKQQSSPASPGHVGPTPVVEVRHLAKRYGDTLAVDDVSLKVQRGKVLAVIGPSGSGKSTMLRCINALERPDSGEVLVLGQPVGQQRTGRGMAPAPERSVAIQRRRIGMVFQRFNLFPHMTVLENVTEAPTRVLGVQRDEARSQAVDLLSRIGLEMLANRYPSSLSGGQQQRVAIARALAMRPALMLFDEPTSALDVELAADVLDVMASLAAEGMTMVVVTHELSFAHAVADRVAFMEHGRVVDLGPPDAVLAGRNERVARFLSRVSRRNFGSTDFSGGGNEVLRSLAEPCAGGGSDKGAASPRESGVLPASPSAGPPPMPPFPK